MKDYVVAVVGATGAVGSTMLRVLQESTIPVREVRALATARSAGRTVSFAGKEVVVEDVARASFAGVDIALFAGGEIASTEYVPAAVEAGAVVIDNSSAYRMDPRVPLVVPEVNAHHLDGHHGIIANPNCSTIQMVVALAPLYAKVGLRRVSAATYQSVSGTGKDAIEELLNQTRARVTGEEPQAPSVYPYPIAFNILPHIASFAEDGYTGEEIKMMLETKKILDAPDLPVVATCARVPVLYAHSEVVQVETERPISPDEVRALLAESPGIKVMDDPEHLIYPTPQDAEHQDLVLVGRIRRDKTVNNGLVMWVVGDNLRKGAATNAVQIAESLIAKDLVRVVR